MDSFHRAGVALYDISVETGDAAIIRSLLLQTNFLTAFLLNQMYREVASEEVVVLLIERKGSSREISIAQRIGVKPSFAAAELMRFVRARVKRVSDPSAIFLDSTIR